MDTQLVINELDTNNIDIGSLKENIENKIKITDDEFDKKAYNLILNRIEEIETLNSVNSYNLVFIGQKGVGKTTSISHIFRLLGIFEKTKKGKKFEVIEELLETGSGGTTICDVVIKQSESNKTYFKATPVTKKELITYLENFAEIVWKNMYNIENSSEEPFYLPSEIERAIRNVLNLRFKKDIDEAEELAKQYRKDELDKFKKEIIERANLDIRTRIEFEFENNSKFDKKTWIKNCFRDINLVNSFDMSIPRKIELFIEKDIFDFEDLPKVKSIVDTRGIDAQGNFDRKDIEQYIRNDKESICIFTDSFPASPSDAVFKVLKRFLYDESMKDLANKIMLLVLNKFDEAEKIISYQGKVETEEEGIRIRKKDIENKFISQNIPFNSENIIFYNALKYYDDGKIKIDIDDLEEYGCKEKAIEEKLSLIELDRINILKIINSVVKNKEIIYYNEVEKLSEEFENIKFKFENDEYAKELLMRIKKDLIELSQKDVMISKMFLAKYKNKLNSVHPSTLAAINRCYGIFGNDDVYYFGSVVIEEIFNEALKESKDFIIGKIDSVLKLKNISISTRVYFERLYDRINKEYYETLKKLNVLFYNKLKDDVFTNSKEKCREFWEEVAGRWGKGSGYRYDVVSMYLSHITGDAFYKYIDSIVVSEWKEFIKVMIELC